MRRALLAALVAAALAASVLDERWEEFVCATGADARIDKAWLDVRRYFERYTFRNDLPDVVFLASEGTHLWAELSDRGVPMAMHMYTDFLRPLHKRADCPPGRWACWFAQQEMRWLRGAGGRSRMRAAAEAMAGGGEGGASWTPLTALLLPSGIGRVPGPRWASVADKGFHIFWLLARFGQMFTLAMGTETASRPAMSGLSAVMWRLSRVDEAWASHTQLFVDGLFEVGSVAGRVFEAGGNASRPSPSRGQRLRLTADAEAAVRGWASRALGHGLGPGSVVLAVLELAAQVSLFDGIQRLFIADVIRFHASEMLPSREMGLAVGKIRAALARRCSGCPSASRRFPASAMPRSPPAICQSGTSGTRVRCSLAMRLLRDGHITSESVRSRRRVYCGTNVLAVLWAYAQGVEACLASGSASACPPLRYADVGTNIGDCVLAAAVFLPEGYLRGVALDADERALSILRGSLRLNRLDVPTPNASFIDARMAFFSNSRALPPGVIVDGHVGVTPAKYAVSPGAPPPRQVRRLDDDLALLGRGSSNGVVDVVSVYGNGGFELPVLRGAQRALGAGRVRCVMVSCPTRAPGLCSELVAFFGSVGYEAEAQRPGAPCLREGGAAVARD